MSYVKPNFSIPYEQAVPRLIDETLCQPKARLAPGYENEEKLPTPKLILNSIMGEIETC